MKYKNIALFLTLALGVSACNIKPVDNEQIIEITENNNQNTESEIVYASFLPIYNLTKQIAGDKFYVKSFTNLKTESHGWEPSAKDIAELSNSQVMFINGAGMEEWEESLESSSDIELVNTTKDVELIKGSHDHDHKHDDEYNDHEHEEESTQEHHHGHDDNHQHHHHGEFDPHTWLSPKNAIAQAKVIVEKLSEIDPANKDYYMDNYKKIEEELSELIDEYREKFNNLDKKNFLVNHKAFSYLAHDFDLNQIALTDIASTEDLSAKDLKELIDLANELDTSTIFYEKGTDGKSAKTLADEIGIKTDVLNTLEFASDDDLANNTTYQELIEENLEALYQSMIN